MSRGLVNVFLVVLVVVALANHACGSCSQFGHSCFGAHGKRNGGGDQYESLVPPALYPAANQVPELEPKQEEQRLPLDVGSVTNRDIVANARYWLAILSGRLRQRPASQSTASAQSFNYLK